MKNYFLLLFSILISLQVNAQQATIKGSIVDSENKAQEFANVLLLNPADSSLIKGVVSNFDGNYEFEKVAYGDYLVSTSLIGFNDAYSPIIKVNAPVVTVASLTLTEGVALSEVMVTAKKPFIEMKADRIVVNVENSSINSGNSALEVLQKSPGVTVDKDNNISLRGKQGVLVMINGKNQYMSGDELSRLLESMPADNIKNIEIITNPSAKYDAEGNSGIINIVMRKNENYGYNGSVNVGARQGQKFTYNGGLDLNYRSAKMNIYGSGSFYDWSGFQDIHLVREIPYEGKSTTFDQVSNMNFSGISTNVKLGMDYYLTDNTTLGVLYKLNNGGSLWTNDNMTSISGGNAPDFSSLMVDTDQDSYRGQNSFNFNVAHNFDDKGTKVTFDVDYSQYDGGSDNIYINNYLNDAGNSVRDQYSLKNDQRTDISIFASRLDFTKTLAKEYQLELGAKYSMVRTDNDTKFSAFENQEWVNQVDRTNNFIYDESVIAAYANIAKSFGKVNVQAGLRMEHTNSNGNSITLDQSVPRTYTDLFPSVSLSHKLGEKHDLSYSYSKRLNRPNYQALNPFVEYLDDYTFEKGNPFLNPQYSDAIGVNYGYGGFLFVSANYSYTKDAITEVIEQNSELSQTFQTNVNLDNYNSGSLTVSSGIPWKEFGMTRINLTSFYNGFKSVIPSGTLNNQSLGYNIYLGNEFNLPLDITMELNANYQSGLTYGLFEISPQYGIDMGFSKDVLKGKGSIKIGLDDIFYTRQNKVQIRQDDIILNIDQMRDSRRVKASFKYNFGSEKVKGARRRTTATEDESSRISNDN
ncbi:TonB-dependent receptor domain-containing protein [Portibacter lacus]|uniref:TonB-dependent receptor n=1 Tax=Portibacter lacus TaxID=1099794 RepID=A0AA37SPG3_9BACT|nr:TonB-dependent receptor [Portibacter lacus]GLR16446.1 TonB-dependent receptor [Portibacter lacus]